METILLTGGSGLIGQNLTKVLISKGYKVLNLSRKKSASENTFFWNIEENIIDSEAIKKATYVIHLAGAGIADKRWTSQRKKEIIDSRTKSTELLFKKIKELNPSLKAFISASGIGFYGAITTSTIFTEDDSPGNDFLANVCIEWEKSVMKFSKENIRTAIVRTGVVLTKTGGALEKIVKPIKIGVGSTLGTGKQFMPWIHIDDLCNLYLKCIEDSSISGIYNAVADEHITNKELTYTIARKLNKKILLPPVPAFVLNLIFGKLAVILLEGSRVSNNKIKDAHFKFKFTKVEKALNDLL